jgi:phospho-N-acetylmuramoyl-pentapeptide-transferase
VLIWILFGFAVAALAGLLALTVLDRLQVRQHAYEDAPESHQTKTGTPTMGGLIFVIVLVGAGLLARTALLTDLVFLVVFCAAVGAIDDLIKVRNGGNRGLPARTKLLATALGAAIFLRAVDAAWGQPTGAIFHAVGFSIIVPHWLWLLLGILAIVGTIHAVNLTDGLDGLAAGTMIPPLLVISFVAAGMQLSAASIASSAGAGACAGFLLFNRHPAKLFMGDTGSLALGALLSGAAILSGEMLLLIVVGGVFVAEALSVILQVSYFKATGGKRIFRMSPLHHHFELLGWRETKVTLRFWLASLVCSLIGWAIVR